jgi:hypothetical protein
MKREPFKVGNWYLTIGGRWICIKRKTNVDSYYETVVCSQGIHRYSNPNREDFGRVTGSNHDFSDPRNLIPLYTAE